MKRRRIVLAEGIESSMTSEKVEKNAMSDGMPAQTWCEYSRIVLRGRGLGAALRKTAEQKLQV